MSKLVVDYLQSLSADHRKLLGTSRGRQVLTKYNFKTFCLTYFRDVLKSPDTGNEITLSEFHEAFIAEAVKYTRNDQGPAESRTAWVCPRGSGKSTWMMILIIWLAAHKHQKFVTLFSATSSQAEAMLANIRSQFNTNELLRTDFPDLVSPATRRNEAMKLSDNKQLIMQANGFICTGRGIDSSVLGMRIDNTRPTMILLDDIEGGEQSYTANDAVKRLITLQDDILPLGLNAHVVWVGTTTRPKGLTETLVHKALDMAHAEWVDVENFKVNYWPAIKENDDGTYRSIWEERWTTEFLVSQMHTRSYAKNYKCLPAPDDYAYWMPETFTYAEPPELDYVVLSVDPAVTTKQKSDFTGISIVGYSKSLDKTWVLHAEQVKKSGVEIRDRLAELLEMYPQIGLVYVETNQGGNMWTDLFKVLPVKVKSVHQTIKKEVRAGMALAEYEKGKVVHARPFTALEDQMIAFPGGAHDDMVDSTGSAIIYFAEAAKNANSHQSRAKVSSGSYL